MALAAVGQGDTSFIVDDEAEAIAAIARLIAAVFAPVSKNASRQHAWPRTMFVITRCWSRTDDRTSTRPFTSWLRHRTDPSLAVENLRNIRAISLLSSRLGAFPPSPCSPQVLTAPHCFMRCGAFAVSTSSQANLASSAGGQVSSAARLYAGR